jgi:mannose-6-phosphate isomerase
VQPLKFTRVLKEKVWGGREFETFFHIPLEPGKRFGESWEISAHPHGPSVVAEGPWAGKTLPELLAAEGPRLVGRSVWEKYGERFPLLIKYLDIHDKLSIQVHPNDEYGFAHSGEPGKSECWLVLQASADARLILGAAPGISRQEFGAKARAGQWQGLFREVPVAANDFIHITPGTIHASVSGSILICEIQQSSDTTYRLYDFDRLENGKPRELHIDQALEVALFDDPIIRRAGTRRRFKADGAVLEPLVVDPHYTVDKVEITGRYQPKALDKFLVWSVLEGAGYLEHEGASFEVIAGDTWLQPAKAAVTWTGPLTLLRSTV